MYTKKQEIKLKAINNHYSWHECFEALTEELTALRSQLDTGTQSGYPIDLIDKVSFQDKIVNVMLTLYLLSAMIGTEKMKSLEKYKLETAYERALLSGAI